MTDEDTAWFDVDDLEALRACYSIEENAHYGNVLRNAAEVIEELRALVKICGESVAIASVVAAMPEDDAVNEGLECLFCFAYFGVMTGPNPRNRDHEPDCPWMLARSLYPDVAQ